MTMPNVSQDALTLWGFLPQFVQEQDANNSYTFLVWLDGIGTQLQVIDDLSRDEPAGFDADNPYSTEPGWGELLDVDECPDYALPWLAQFVGTRFTSVQVTPTQRREAIRTPAGWGRGTVQSFELAARPFIGPNGTIYIIERTPDPYSFTLVLYGLPGYNYSQLDSLFTPYNTLDSTFAIYDDFTQPIAELEAALANAKPAGLIMTLVFSRDYDQIDALYTPYGTPTDLIPGSLAATFPLYNNIF